MGLFRKGFKPQHPDWLFIEFSIAYKRNDHGIMDPGHYLGEFWTFMYPNYVSGIKVLTDCIL